MAGGAEYEGSTLARESRISFGTSEVDGFTLAEVSIPFDRIVVIVATVLSLLK